MKIGRKEVSNHAYQTVGT